VESRADLSSESRDYRLRAAAVYQQPPLARPIRCRLEDCVWRQGAGQRWGRCCVLQPSGPRDRKLKPRSGTDADL